MWGLTSLQSQFFLVPFADVLLPCHLSREELVAGTELNCTQCFEEAVETGRKCALGQK